MFLPWGARFSVDKVLHPAWDKLPDRYLSSGTAAYVMQIAFVFWFGALWKSGPEWRVDNGSGNADGFGVFERNIDKGSGNETTAGTTNWLVFMLDDAPANLNNWDFAAHVQYNDDCSGWVSDRIHPNPGSSAECGSARVPEPSAMILFGVGLVSLAVWGRRRLGRRSVGAAH
jgi:hypothetical protein